MSLTSHGQIRTRGPLLAALAGSAFLGLGLVATRASATATPGAPTSAAENKYIGSDKCKSCHGAADSGDQHAAWKGSLHAKAFERLSSAEAKKLGAEKGIADVTKADECVSCHVTAFGVPDEQIKKGFDRTQGVQCEVCHGPGEAHMKARFAAAAKGEAAQGYTSVPAGEIIAMPGEETCRTCHNEKSPSYKPFCFHEFEAKILHLNPKKPRTELGLGPCSCPKCAQGCPDSCKGLAALK